MNMLILTCYNRYGPYGYIGTSVRVTDLTEEEAARLAEMSDSKMRFYIMVNIECV